MLPYIAAYFLLDLFAALLTKPDELIGLWFTAAWALLFSGLVMLFPRKVGRVLFGITYGINLVWAMAQTGYYAVFNKMMWIHDTMYMGEGVGFFMDTLKLFPVMWWIGGVLLIALGVFLTVKFPKVGSGRARIFPAAGIAAFSLCMLFVLPELIFLLDIGVFGTHSEYGQSSSYRATYNTMYDAKRVYEICGLYQLMTRDIWVHEIYPRTPAYAAEQKDQIKTVKAYFDGRGDHEKNEMTGLFAGKNVILVLMESIDDFLLTQEETPTICRLMDEGINFTDFYTPGYGTARTLNTEFCMNTGIYLPTTGDYVFDYVTNDFNESLASSAVRANYTAEVYHYNSPEFYSRGVMEPALGYHSYISFEDYLPDEDDPRMYDDCTLFDIDGICDSFFRDGKTFNTIITRSAHLGYTYNEVLSKFALSRYPEYRGLYGSEEEDCIRVKAKLVDDMFARLIEELDARDQLDNTVIIGITDHYAYGMKNTVELLSLSNADQLIMLEKTPCFIWSADCPRLSVDKTMNTSDFLPTVLNLMGLKSRYKYLGQDIFDPDYAGYALFPDGSWISNGVACRITTAGDHEVMFNKTGKGLMEKYINEMAKTTSDYIHINNLLLTCDYYSKVR